MSSAVLLLVAFAWLFPRVCEAAQPSGPIVVYSTGFEYEEGYTAADDGVMLRNQMGWNGEGSGGNGLVTNFFEGYGQQAFVGFTGPAFKDEFLNIWRPVVAKPPRVDRQVLKFSVLMQIEDSTNGNYDDFRWSAYNTAGSRLFSLSFNNYRAEVEYALDDGVGVRPTGFVFQNGVPYQLDVWMNFARNTWMAMMNGVVVVPAQPLTTINARMDLSDVDAVWALRAKGFPGDNFMLFDEYVITIEDTPSIPPILELLGFGAAGDFQLLVHGERSGKYALDVTSDLWEWFPLGTNTLSDGEWLFKDQSAPDYSYSIYRVRQVSGN